MGSEDDKNEAAGRALLGPMTQLATQASMAMALHQSLDGVGQQGLVLLGAYAISLVFGATFLRRMGAMVRALEGEVGAEEAQVRLQSPEGSDVVGLIFRGLLEAPDEAAVPALTALGREYLARGRKPDPLLRGAARMFAECSADDIEGFARILKPSLSEGIAPLLVSFFPVANGGPLPERGLWSNERDVDVGMSVAIVDPRKAFPEPQPPPHLIAVPNPVRLLDLLRSNNVGYVRPRAADNPAPGTLSIEDAQCLARALSAGMS